MLLVRRLGSQGGWLNKRRISIFSHKHEFTPRDKTKTRRSQKQDKRKPQPQNEHILKTLKNQITNDSHLKPFLVTPRQQKTKNHGIQVRSHGVFFVVVVSRFPVLPCSRLFLETWPFEDLGVNFSSGVSRDNDMLAFGFVVCFHLVGIVAGNKLNLADQPFFTCWNCLEKWPCLVQTF